MSRFLDHRIAANLNDLEEVPIEDISGNSEEAVPYVLASTQPLPPSKMLAIFKDMLHTFPNKPFGHALKTNSAIKAEEPIFSYGGNIPKLTTFNEHPSEVNGNANNIVRDMLASLAESVTSSSSDKTTSTENITSNVVTDTNTFATVKFEEPLFVPTTIGDILSVKNITTENIISTVSSVANNKMYTVDDDENHFISIQSLSRLRTTTTLDNVFDILEKPLVQTTEDVMDTLLTTETPLFEKSSMPIQNPIELNADSTTLKDILTVTREYLTEVGTNITETSATITQTIDAAPAVLMELQDVDNVTSSASSENILSTFLNLTENSHQTTTTTVDNMLETIRDQFSIQTPVTTISSTSTFEDSISDSIITENYFHTDQTTNAIVAEAVQNVTEVIENMASSVSLQNITSVTKFDEKYIAKPTEFLSETQTTIKNILTTVEDTYLEQPTDTLSRYEGPLLEMNRTEGVTSDMTNLDLNASTNTVLQDILTATEEAVAEIGSAATTAFEHLTSSEGTSSTIASVTNTVEQKFINTTYLSPGTQSTIKSVMTVFKDKYLEYADTSPFTTSINDTISDIITTESPTTILRDITASTQEIKTFNLTSSTTSEGIFSTYSSVTDTDQSQDQNKALELLPKLQSTIRNILNILRDRYLEVTTAPSTTVNDEEDLTETSITNISLNTTTVFRDIVASTEASSSETETIVTDATSSFENITNIYTESVTTTVSSVTKVFETTNVDQSFISEDNEWVLYAIFGVIISIVVLVVISLSLVCKKRMKNKRQLKYRVSTTSSNAIMV